MSQRRYGPTRGAGTAIIEKEGEKPIEAGALGFAGYAGILEKGQVGELITCLSKQDYLRKCGSYIEDGELPDNCIDYFDAAAGAGGILLVRVTDGDEVQAQATLRCRRMTQTPMGSLRAKNGGRWGGKAAKYTDDMPTGGAVDLTATTLATGQTMVKDEWKGGYIELAEVPNKQYAIVGNTAAGIVFVDADQDMLADWTAGGATDDRFYLVRANDGKALSYEIRDGIESPSTEFGLYIYTDGVLTISWQNLSTDPTSDRYWINRINNDGSNCEVEAADLWTGAHVATVRPANHYGEIATVTETVLTAVIHEFNPAMVGDADGTFALGTTADTMDAQTITCTFSAPTAFDAVSDKYGALGSGTVGTLFTPNNKWSPPFTLTAGVTAWEALDVATLVYKPFVADELIGGSLYPDKVNAMRELYRIVGNSHNTITVATGSDLTASGAPGDEFMAVAPQEMSGGIDGNASIVDADYENLAWDVGASPFNRIRDKGFGLVKFATPGVTATSVQKAGAAYAAAKGHQYRYEIPSGIVSEVGADEYVNDTLGRNDFAVVAFPSYAYAPDPEAKEPGNLKLTSLTGQIHGREARIAVNYDGYHKAAAGLEAVLPKILKLPTGDAILNEEYLNPLGINVIKKKQGNFVIWGDRTLWVDPNWKWKHQRELMSYYEQVLIESFDWIIFAINDPIEEKRAIAALNSFFYPEWVKRAIRGNTFKEAAIIKIDGENNTDATRAAGDMFADISLRLADTVERFVIRIGKQGVFENVAA